MMNVVDLDLRLGSASDAGIFFSNGALWHNNGVCKLQIGYHRLVAQRSVTSEYGTWSSLAQNRRGTITNLCDSLHMSEEEINLLKVRFRLVRGKNRPSLSSKTHALQN